MRTDCLQPGEAVALVGGGGHARVVLALVESLAGYVAGVVSPDPDSNCLGLRWLGSDKSFQAKQASRKLAVVIALGDVQRRRQLAVDYRRAGFRIPTVLHPAALVAWDVQVGRGVQVFAGAVVQPGAVLRDDVLVNTGAIVEHDVVVGTGTHIAPGAIVLGGASIGYRSFVGAGAVVLPTLTVGALVTVGAGSVVTKPVARGVTILGNPARTARG